MTSGTQFADIFSEQLDFEDGVMKFNLLASASTLALGSLVSVVLPTAGQATPSCNLAGTSCTETFSDTLGSNKVNFGPLAGTLPFFTPVAGQHDTLTSVIISESSTGSTSGHVTNNNNSPVTVTFNGGYFLSLTGGSKAPSGFPSLNVSAPRTATLFNSEVFHIGANGTAPYGESSIQSGATISAKASNLGGFVGSGSFTFESSAMAHNVTGSNAGNFTASLTTFADPTISVTYNYTVTTPEPASLAVLGSALAGTGLLRRRRNAG